MLALIVIGMVVFVQCALGRLLSKTGENGWKILIPVYGGYLLYKACKCTWLFIVNTALSALSMISSSEEMLLVILLATMVVNIIFYVFMAKAFGKGAGFAVGMVFLSVIFLGILAFGDSRYQYGIKKNNARKTAVRKARA